MLYKCEIEVVKCKIFARLHADIQYTQMQNEFTVGWSFELDLLREVKCSSPPIRSKNMLYWIVWIL